MTMTRQRRGYNTMNKGKNIKIQFDFIMIRLTQAARERGISSWIQFKQNQIFYDLINPEMLNFSSRCHVEYTE